MLPNARSQSKSKIEQPDESKMEEEIVRMNFGDFNNQLKAGTSTPLALEPFFVQQPGQAAFSMVHDPRKGKAGFIMNETPPYASSTTTRAAVATSLVGLLQEYLRL